MGDFAEREALAQDLQGESNVIAAYPAPMRNQEAISRAVDAGWRQVEVEAQMLKDTFGQMIMVRLDQSYQNSKKFCSNLTIESKQVKV